MAARPRIRYAYLYPEIRQSLLDAKRLHVPELTDESDFEVSNQIYNSLAFALHVYNQTAELVANEAELQTAQLRESVRRHGKSLGYVLQTAQPAAVEMVLELSKAFPTTLPIEVVPVGAQVATTAQGDEAPIVYESFDSVSVSKTNRFSSVLNFQGGEWTDRTAAVEAGTFPIWLVPPAINDAIYFLHSDVMWKEVEFAAPEQAAPEIGIWEFHQGDWQRASPDSVQVEANQIRLGLNGYLGNGIRQGTEIQVTHLRTGASERVFSVWTGNENIVRCGLLGQSDPDTAATAYSVGSNWEELKLEELSQSPIGQSTKMAFELPQTETQTWRKVSLNGLPEAYAIRYRVLIPSFEHTRLDSVAPSGKPFVAVSASQGTTKPEERLGVSDGQPSQRFRTTLDHFIDDGQDEIIIDDEEWSRVDSLIGLGADDQAYVVDLEENDRAYVRFGDGQQGKIPPLRSPIFFSYRHGATTDGNVGAGAVTTNRSSLAFVGKLWNPKGAHGWTPPEGNTEAELELTKRRIGQSVRDKDVAHTADGILAMAYGYRNNGGSRLVARGFPIENGFGVNTVELVVVGVGGRELTVNEREELQLFFNGDPDQSPPEPSRVGPNLRVYVTNAQRRTIDIQATIYVSARVQEESIENQLRQIVQPTVRNEDGDRYEWDFGEAVARSRIEHEIHRVSRSIVRVELLQPSGDVELSGRQLPVIGNVALTVVRENGE